MCFGFLISSLCDSQAVAMQLSIGSFYPNLLLSGILWPLEGMPTYLRMVARFLPNTLACQAMRDIMLRGWGIDREEVYLGVSCHLPRLVLVYDLLVPGDLLLHLDHDLPHTQLGGHQSEDLSKIYLPLLEVN